MMSGLPVLNTIEFGVSSVIGKDKSIEQIRVFETSLTHNF